MSPENAAMAGDNRSFTVPTGIGTIHVHDGGPETGPTALLWPNLFTDAYATWGPQIGTLHAMGWRTFLVDPPGINLVPAVSASALSCELPAVSTEG